MKKPTTEIWDNYYQNYDYKELWTGNEYPNETLIRFVSNQRKKKNKFSYFKDSGKRFSLKNNFKGKALEIGFGGLANLKMLQKKGYDCIGLEVSKNVVDKSKKLLKKEHNNKIKTILWKDTRILPFEKNQFDLIVGLQCIYYNLDLKNIIKEVKRVLKKNGKFIFSFFSERHEYYKYISIVDKKKKIIKWNNKHPNKDIRGAELYHIQNKKELLKLFKDFNIKIYTWETDELPLFQSWWYVVN